jgi:RHS repeat-associated protein
LNPTANTGTWIDYVNGMEYKSLVLNRLPHPEGSIVRNDAGNYELEYTLKDHLGNNRVVFRDKDNDRIIDTSDIKQINYTFPFGMDMEGNWNGSYMGTGTQGNPYKYNGKEFNNDYGLNWYHYGARFYDPAIGRWHVVDPLSEKYQNLSPYNYVANNPVKFVDPDGKDIVVPNKAQQAAILEMIHSKSSGTFKFDENNKLTEVNRDSKEGHSDHYRDRLLEAIEPDTKTITIATETKSVTLNGEERDLKEFGESITIDKFGTGNQEVYLSGKDNPTFDAKDGSKLEDYKAADLLMHELLGHAIPSIIGGGTGDAIKNENKAREQIKGAKERKEEENHPENFRKN